MSNIIEKLIWILVPLLLSAIIHMWSTLQSTKEAVNELKLSAEIERQRLKEEILAFANENRQIILILQERVKNIENNEDK